MSEKAIAVHQYSLTELGKEAFPVVQRFDSHVARAFRDYKSQMTELADKYSIPEEKRNQFMAAMLNSWAAQLFGLSDDVYQRLQSLEQTYEDSQARLQRIQQRAREFLE